MIKTTCHCDNCGVQVEKEHELARIEVKLAYYQGHWWNKLKDMHICTECAGKVGIFKKEVTPVETTPGIEDRLYDIFAEMVDDSVANM